MKVETQLPLGKVDPGIRAGEVRLDVRDVGEQAVLAERLGFDAIALTETKDDPFVAFALAAASTSRIRLVTAVALAFPRSPTITAMSAWTLAKLSDGRFTLGLGTQVKGHIERRFGVAWSAPGPSARTPPTTRTGPGSRPCWWSPSWSAASARTGRACPARRCCAHRAPWPPRAGCPA